MANLQWNLSSIVWLLVAGCAPLVDGVDDSSQEELPVVEAKLPLAYPGDQSVTMYVLRYDCGKFLDPSHCDQGDGVLGPGGGHLRAINNVDKKDIFLSFPQGHPANPETIVFLTTGQQDGDGNADVVTGQSDGYKWDLDYDAKSRQRTLSGNSLYGRLLNRFGASGVYYILVHDNAANWGDGNSEAIHHQFAKYVAAKVGTSTKRIVLAGYSRGGYAVAHMARSFRDGIAPVSNAVSVYAGLFDPVAGGGDGFGVDTNDYQDNPIVGDGSYKKEKTSCWNQVAQENRKNNTHFFAVVGGESVFGGVHAFGCAGGYSVFPSYWNESWVSNAHGDWKNTAHNARTIDPFWYWLDSLSSTVERGIVRANGEYQYLTQGQTQDLYIPVRSGGLLSFRTTNDAGYSADLDLTLYDPNGRSICGAYSWSTTEESLSCPAPSGGTYRLQIRGYSGAAQFRYFAQSEIDKNSTGAIALPREELNATSGYRRTYRMVGTGAAHPIHIELRWAEVNKNLDLALFDCNGTMVASSNTNRAMETINYAAPSGGCYEARISSNATSTTEYSLYGFASLYNSTN